MSVCIVCCSDMCSYICVFCVARSFRLKDETFNVGDSVYLSPEAFKFKSIAIVNLHMVHIVRQHNFITGWSNQLQKNTKREKEWWVAVCCVDGWSLGSTSVNLTSNGIWDGEVLLLLLFCTLPHVLWLSLCLHSSNSVVVVLNWTALGKIVSHECNQDNSEMSITWK